MRVHWHQFWLLLCTLGLWWWGWHEPAPMAPWSGTVVGHDVRDDRRTVTRVVWTGPDGAPTISRLAGYGLRHEPGQVIAVYPVAGDPGVVAEWTGREWPWRAWQAPVEDYNSYADAYSAILRRYENHDNVDFMLMKLAKAEFYKLPWWYWMVAYGRFAFQFSPYVVLLLLEAAWLSAIISGVKFTAA